MILPLLGIIIGLLTLDASVRGKDSFAAQAIDKLQKRQNAKQEFRR